MKVKQITEQKIYDYLFIKASEGKIQQIRSIYRFECYSALAIKRLTSRAVTEELKDYRSTIKAKIEEAAIGENNEIYSKASKSVYSGLITDKIKDKFEIIVEQANDKLVLKGSNLTILSRFIIFLLCDFIDLDNDVKIKINDEVKAACLDCLEQKIPFDKLPSYLSLHVSMKELCSICGITIEDGYAICQPYRSDITSKSDIVGDLFSAAISFYEDEKEQAHIEKNKLQIISKIQSGLNYLGYSYCTLEKEYESRDEKIAVTDKNMRNISYPHKLYSIEKQENNFKGVTVWYSGYKLDINSFAEEIRRIVDLSLNASLEYNLCGTEITGKMGERTVARIHLIDKELISAHNTNGYLIATAYIDLND